MLSTANQLPRFLADLHYRKFTTKGIFPTVYPSNSVCVTALLCNEVTKVCQVENYKHLVNFPQYISLQKRWNLADRKQSYCNSFLDHSVNERRKRVSTANIGRAKVFLVIMHALPEMNECTNIIPQLTATLCWIHWSVASLHTQRIHCLFTIWVFRIRNRSHITTHCCSSCSFCSSSFCWGKLFKRASGPTIS